MRYYDIEFENFSDQIIANLPKNANELARFLQTYENKVWRKNEILESSGKAANLM